MAGQPTIHDVAARAGVSKSLVSLVMRGSDRVSQRRRAEVLRVAAELGYRPNAVARSLVQRRTRTVGFMLSDLHNPFFAELADGIQAQAREHGYRMLIMTGDRSPAGEAEALETLLELRVDGVILAGPRVSASAIVDAGRSVPVVVVAGKPRISTVDTVVSDDLLGARVAVEHLVELGHRRIAYIDGGNDPGARLRRRGYERAMAGCGVERYIAVARGDFTEAGGQRGARALLQSRPQPTAIFAANDLAAVGALRVIEEAGIAVPDDVSLVGYDNTALAAMHHLSLTTIDQPRFEMGETALTFLLERIQGRSRARRAVLPPTLIPRATSGPRTGRAP